MYSSSNYYQGDTLLEADSYLLSYIFDTITAFTNAVLWNSESLVNRSESLSLYFGTNANQDENFIYINKADLIGLIPSNNNSAESLLVALISRLIDVLDKDIDVILVSLFDIYIKNNTKLTYTILIYTFYPATAAQQELEEDLQIIPDNYALL